MPFKPTERLYRSFAASNFQPVEQEEPTDSQEPSYKVRGYYTVWNSEYELYPRTKYWPAEYEQVDRHALDDADLSDVIFQENHEGSPLARIRNGSLQLGTDDHGAWCIADLGGCQRGREIYESIKNGLIVEMSFGFIIASDEDSEGYTSFKDENGDYHTTITRIQKVFDCSCVSIPASPYTEISELRSLSAARKKIEAERAAAESKETKSEEVAEPQPEETRSSQAENSIEDVTVTVDGVSYEGVEDVTARSYKGLTVEAVVEGFDIEDMATRIASILAERSAKEVGEKLSEPEQEVSEPVSDSKARRMRRARALQLSHI